jgi:DNA-binding XRE family transcriptional regulator
MAKKFVPVNTVRRTWLEERRKAMKLTHRTIAPKIGISYSHYGDIEAGRRNPSLDMSYKLAIFFDVPVELFFDNRTKYKMVGEN